MPTIGPLLARDLGSFVFEVPSDPIARVSARVRVSYSGMPTIGPLLARDLGSFAFEVPSDPIARVSARVLCFVFGHAHDWASAR